MKKLKTELTITKDGKDLVKTEFDLEFTKKEIRTNYINMQFTKPLATKEISEILESIKELFKTMSNG